ncbi:uncharacterized protein LOC126668819 isoform X2 [Mercurialis annua]|uniref:uncharacterized protein LOC126668819 isoform X2 n=1 Tax=Mercurialis annua TaxID=3986 RepID=UPI00215EBAF3|nr:uncharacterized protein LOC126668819 isoform X2 [Mercurialis annua]
MEKSDFDLDLIGISGLATEESIHGKKVDDKNVEPSTNLCLAVGYSNQCIQRILNNDPGAGANAASAAYMTLVAADPLSELVWSPHKGLCIRCADGSFTEKNPSLSWGVGPTIMANASNSDKPVSNTDKPTNSEIRIASLAACNLACEVAGRNITTIFPTSIMPISGTSLELRTASGDQLEEMKNGMDFRFLQNENRRSKKGKDVPELNMGQNYPTSEEPIVRASDISDRKHALRMGIVLASEINTLEKFEVYDTEIISGKRKVESTSIRENDSKNKMVIRPHALLPLDKLESTAENDVATPFGENVLPSECPDRRIENNTRHGDELLPVDKTLAVNPAPANSRFRKKQKKGKSRALSDGDAKERMSNEEDGSHESVESCNSGRLFSTGKRQWNDQQLIVSSKRVKGQTNQDSSFMNWISNMMKGVLKSSEEKEPSISHGHENPEQDTFASNREEDPTCRPVGFQSIFQSLYCRKTNTQQAVTLNADHQQEGFIESELDNKMCDLNATPIACRMVTGNVYKRLLPSTERFNDSASGNQAGTAFHSRDILMNFSAIRESNRSISTENQNSCNVETGRAEDGISFNSSKGEKMDSKLASEEKPTHNFDYKGEPLESLWISRFTPKTSGPSLNNKRTGEPLNCCADGMKLKPLLQNPLGSSSKLENVEAKKHSTEASPRVQNSGTADEASFSFYKVKRHSDEISTYKPNPILPSSGVKFSEAMASVFARRLDALKHIPPSYNTDPAAHETMTCFFCGIRGHHLQECPYVTDTELEDLLGNVNSYEGIKELPCVCIRCNQLSHWAVACPNIAANARAVCYRNESGIEKECASSSRVKGLKENQMAAPYGLISGLISDIPNGISDAVRSLRLTRTNILKWMKSDVPLSPLDGYFVRLRLGKWEEGLGGTGYYVARITGIQIESSSKKCKASISLNVGGIRSVVESRYVSNHDFLEDELRAWWSATLTNGGTLPSEEELRLKVEEKKKLGF